MKHTIAQRTRKLLLAVVALAVGATSAAQVLPAHAAEINAIDADSIKLSNVDEPTSELRINDIARVEAKWAIPDGSGNDADTFTLGLPKVLRGLDGTFELKGDDQASYGTCAITSTEVVCTLNANVAGKNNVGGDLWFNALANGEHTGSTVAFTLNGTTKEVPLPNNATGIGYNAELPTAPFKTGYFEGDALMWRIVIPGDQLAGKPELTIKDDFDEDGFELSLEAGYPEVFSVPATPKCWAESHSSECRQYLFRGNGGDYPNADLKVDDDADEISGTIAGPFAADRIYLIEFKLNADTAIPVGSEFHNVATINGETLEHTFARQATGGGTGAGDTVGHLQISKKVTGSTAPANTVYPVVYSYQKDGAEVTGTLEVTTDAPAVLRNVPHGTTVTLTEHRPKVIGLIFKDPTFEGDGVSDDGPDKATATVTIEGTKRLEVTLTNPAEDAEKVDLVDPTTTMGVCQDGAPTNPSITAATTKGINYAASWAFDGANLDEVVFSVIATPLDGYAINPDTMPANWTYNKETGEATYELRVDQPACGAKLVAPVSPNVAAGVCNAETTDPRVTLPETEGLEYKLEDFAVGADKVTVKVTAKAKDGFTIDGGNLPAGWTYNLDGTATFTTEVDVPKCTLVTPVDPTTVVGVCQDGSMTPTDPSITAATTEGINYAASWALDGPNLEQVVFTVEATGLDGYTIDKDNLPDGWTFEKGVATYEKRVDQPSCAKLVKVVSPSVAAGVCTDDATSASGPKVTLPETEGVTYEVGEFVTNGDKVTVKVTAKAKDGVIIDGGNLPEGWTYNLDGTATFTTEVAQPDCRKTVVPVDPKITAGVCKPKSGKPSEPAVSVPVVKGLTYGKPQISVKDGKVTVTVTVTPQQGYRLGDLPKGWKAGDNGTAIFTYQGDNPKCVKPGLPKTGD